MKKLEFEKVGDIRVKYPYLCVYLEGEKNPFMEIGISEEKQIEFKIYAMRQQEALSKKQKELAKKIDSTK